MDSGVQGSVEATGLVAVPSSGDWPSTPSPFGTRMSGLAVTADIDEEPLD